MSINSTTSEKLMFGVGTLEVDGVDVGATTKQGSFVVEPSIYYPELGGSKGPIVGTGIMTGERARITFTLTEMDIAKLAAFLPLVTCGCDGTSTSTLRDTIGPIQAEHHHDVVWSGARADGSPMEIHLDNCLVDGGLTLNLNDDSEAQYELTFQSFYDATNYTQRCWGIYIGTAS